MAKRQPEKRKKIPSTDLQVTAATFTWAILLPAVSLRVTGFL